MTPQVRCPCRTTSDVGASSSGDKLPSHYFAASQYSYNDEAQYCAPWWLDIGKNLKVDVSTICYSIEYPKVNPVTGLSYIGKLGCAHKAPLPVLTARRLLANTTSATPRTLATLADIVNTTAVYSASGLEYNQYRQKWYDCKDGQRDLSQLNICHDDIARNLFGVDAETIRFMMQLVQVSSRG